MAKSEKEMREELLRIRTDEENKKRDAERQALKADREMAQAEARDELIKGRIERDPQSGREIVLWDEAWRLADAAHHSEVRAYDDWRAAMLGLLTMYGMLNKALNQEFKEMRSNIGDSVMTGTTLGDIPVFGDALNVIPTYGPALAAIKTPGALDGCDALTDFLSDKFGAAQEIPLPVLQHKVQFSDDGKLVIDKLTRSDNIDNTAPAPTPEGAPKAKSLDDYFSEAVHEWLAEEGYKPSATNPAKFVNSSGAELTQKAFEELRDNKDHGLNHFLKVNLPNMEFRPSGPSM
ncbi:hypothetical protein [Legionella shakespearei]|uniref:Membrane-associated HD superfamily hydrolase n=1 Tax=Legionella shakespearei DSM 23087 TaxID=1122169 RepID=A0A0W0Z0U4_9GAMM|nr:hypothetical protein [Legionella shakespearei]KTD62746.1 membrane-associated HD superfamily hydrolase [Legionella shakespearei DSM 23087]